MWSSKNEHFPSALLHENKKNVEEIWKDKKYSESSPFALVKETGKRTASLIYREKNCYLAENVHEHVRDKC